ncbi:MAG: hypothetical protein KAR39_08210 [Thermoplasmata archaeon]|nr:hypothetical protein [Thermoplasmata archaeon]
MKFPRYTNYMLILFLVLLSVILRFPSTSHSVGVDAFVMQGLANQIVSDGHAAWIIHPLSYVGLFPLSYPSGGIFLPASLDVLSGYASEISILALSMLMGIIGVLGAYILAREFKNDDLFAFIAAFIFCLAPKFILNTTWETPTRGGFMAFTPIFLFMLLRAHRVPTRKNFAIAVLILFILATFHRLAILMLVVILAYIFTSMFLIVAKIAKLKMPTLFLKPGTRNRMRKLSFVGLFALGLVLLLGSGVLDVYEYGRLMQSDSMPVKALNLGVSLTRSSGVLTPFLLLGTFAFVSQRNKALKEFLIIFIALAIIPTLYLRRYTGFYMPIFIAILAGMGVCYFIRMQRRKKLAVLVAFSALAGSIALTGMLLEYESQSVDSMTMEEYDVGLYARFYLEGTILANNGLPSSRISAISGLPSLPLGGATVPIQSADQLAYGFVDAEEVVVNQVPLDHLTINSDSPFEAPDVPNAELHLWVLHTWRPTNPLYGPFPDQLIIEYDIHYALEDKRFSDHFLAEGKAYSSHYLESQVHYQRYKVYESAGYFVWMSM